MTHRTRSRRGPSRQLGCASLLAGSVEDDGEGAQDDVEVERGRGVAGVVELELLAAAVGVSGVVSGLHLPPARDAGLAAEELVEVVAVVGELIVDDRARADWKSSRDGGVMINALALAGWLTQMFGTLALSSPEAGISKVFKGYLNIPAVAQAICVFVFVRHACERNGAATQKTRQMTERKSQLNVG